jgi:hypothetical protein
MTLMDCGPPVKTDDAWIDEPPPWRVFPDMQPLQVAARQGAQEAWADHVWRPFWAALSPVQRQTYFDHWGASDEWRDAIRMAFEVPADFDAEADAAESEAWLAQRRAEQDAKVRVATGVKGWLQRLKQRR